MGRVLREEVHIVLQGLGIVGIVVELCLEHLEGGAGIVFGRVVMAHRVTAVEDASRFQVAFLALVVDGLHIDELVLRRVKGYTGFAHLLSQQRDVKVITVESGDVAALKHAGDVVCTLLEGGFVLQVLVGDAMHIDGLLGNDLLRVKAESLALLVTIGINLDIG